MCVLVRISQSCNKEPQSQWFQLLRFISHSCHLLMHGAQSSAPCNCPGAHNNSILCPSTSNVATKVTLVSPMKTMDDNAGFGGPGLEVCARLCPHSFGHNSVTSPANCKGMWTWGVSGKMGRDMDVFVHLVASALVCPLGQHISTNILHSTCRNHLLPKETPQGPIQSLHGLMAHELDRKHVFCPLICTQCVLSRGKVTPVKTPLQKTEEWKTPEASGPLPRVRQGLLRMSPNSMLAMLS